MEEDGEDNSLKILASFPPKPVMRSLRCGTPMEYEVFAKYGITHEHQTMHAMSTSSKVK